jgi:YD repeat-containing protein
MLASSTPAQTVGIQRQLAESTPIQGRAELMPAQPGWQDWEPAPGYVGAWPEDRPATMVFSGAMQAAPETPKVVASARTAPLDCFNGEFHHQVVDLMIKSCGFPFVWGRTYSSRASFNQGLGHNWDFTYNRRIVALPGGDVSLSNGLGREDVYRESGGDFLSPRGVFDTLVQNGDTTFTQTLPSGMRLDYDSLGYLAQMTDRAGNTLTLQRNVHHNITQITDTQNRF